MATGFYRNAERGLPPFGGMSMVFSARTGMPEAVLLDGGHLTNVRTAAAGAVAAKHLAPREVRAIGICGSGVQARLQAEYLKAVTPCRDVIVWARDPAKAEPCAADLARSGFGRARRRAAAALAAEANLIVTTTASHTPYLAAEHVRPGTHITAMGSDTAEKAELAADLLARADVVVADSLSQCLVRGEIHHAVAGGLLDAGRVVELGAVIKEPALGRSDDSQITIADLTGVAVQDIQIAKAVCARLEQAGAASDAQGRPGTIQMRFPTFLLERNQTLYENTVEINLTESGVHPCTLADILSDDGDRGARVGRARLRLYGRAAGAAAGHRRLVSRRRAWERRRRARLVGSQCACLDRRWRSPATRSSS